jgi:hypothetical protein
MVKRNTLNNTFTAPLNLKQNLMDDVFIFLAEDDIDDQELLVEALPNLIKPLG